MPHVLRRSLIALASGGVFFFFAWPFVAERWFLPPEDVELRVIDQLPPAPWEVEDDENEDATAVAPPPPAASSTGSPAPPAQPQPTGPRLEPDWASRLPAQTVLRERILTPIPEDIAKELFPIGDGLSEYDPFSGYRYKGGLDVLRILEEHPQGRWHLRTNSTGHRRDTDIAATPPDLRIVVTGDSHTDGVCNNDESYCALLEAALAREGRTVEVLNAAKGGYTFYNYLGCVRRHLQWKPDACIVTVYGGNDFMEALLLHAYFNELPLPTGSKPYWPQVKAAIALRKVAMAQAMLSEKYFSYRPEEVPVAFNAAQQILRILRQICEEEEVRLIVVYLPPVSDVDPKYPWLALDQLLPALEMERADLGSNDQLADSLLAWLAARGVETVDLRPAFRASTEPLYWARDLHLNLAGHRLIAQQLAPLFAEAPR